MKKYLLIIFLITEISFLHAQETDLKKTYKPAITLGMNIASLNNVAGKRKIDFMAGIAGVFKLSHNYIMQPEITFSRQGENSLVDSSRDFNLDYLSVALSNKYTLVKNFGLYLNIGIGLNFLVNNNFDTKQDNEFYELDDRDFIIFGGIGYHFNDSLSLEFRGTRGGNELIVPTDNHTSTVDPDIANKLVQFTLTYSFDFGKKQRTIEN